MSEHVSYSCDRCERTIEYRDVAELTLRPPGGPTHYYHMCPACYQGLVRLFEEYQQS